MFEHATTYTKQGDIGEARAIYEYTKLGYGVSRTLFDSMKYDLIVDIDGELKRVQVKTTTSKSPYGVYQATLKTAGGNKSSSHVRLRSDDDYDLLFVLADNGQCWSIPTSEFTAKNVLSLSEKLENFKL